MKITGASGAVGVMLGLDPQLSKSKCTRVGNWNPRRLCAWCAMMRCACCSLYGRLDFTSPLANVQVTSTLGSMRTFLKKVRVLHVPWL
jgi:hypothetical protein